MIYNFIVSGDVTEDAIQNDVSLIRAMIEDLRFRGLYKAKDPKINVTTIYSGEWMISYHVTNLAESDRVHDRIQAAMADNPIFSDCVTEFISTHPRALA